MSDILEFFWENDLRKPVTTIECGFSDCLQPAPFLEHDSHQAFAILECPFRNLLDTLRDSYFLYFSSVETASSDSLKSASFREYNAFQVLAVAESVRSDLLYTRQDFYFLNAAAPE